MAWRTGLICARRIGTAGVGTAIATRCGAALRAEAGVGAARSLAAGRIAPGSIAAHIAPAIAAGFAVAIPVAARTIAVGAKPIRACFPGSIALHGHGRRFGRQRGRRTLAEQ
jgi:hypothetical protein